MNVFDMAVRRLLPSSSRGSALKTRTCSSIRCFLQLTVTILWCWHARVALYYLHICTRPSSPNLSVLVPFDLFLLPAFCSVWWRMDDASICTHRRVWIWWCVCPIVFTQSLFVGWGITVSGISLSLSKKKSGISLSKKVSGICMMEP